jgi:DNA-binding XRE family transcriptional regulator
VVLSAEKIKEFRSRLKMTQEEFGDLIGISQSSVSKIENSTLMLTKTATKLVCLLFLTHEDG